MRLFELAYACRIYGGLTKFDVGYLDFVDKTGGSLNFRDSAQMKALLVWLNSWGCRQFALAYHRQATESIQRWAKHWESNLPDSSTTTGHLSDRDIEMVGDAYANLSKRLASKRTANGNEYIVRVGPTGAAKILFAARPRAFPPWDDPIRAKLGFDSSPRSYCDYLATVREQVRELILEATEIGVPAENIPLEIGRHRFTLPKLIDEYNWVTLTKGFLPPKPDEIAKWYHWSRRPSR